MLNSALNLNKNFFSSNVRCESTRDGFGEALLVVSEENKNLVVLCGDLTDSVRVTKFAQKYPERFIQCGIAEQNMASIAAGMSLCGKIPLVVSHAIFNSSTNWAQIRLSICMSNLCAGIIGSHQGFSNGPDGAVAESLEDVALMRVLPNMTIYNPVDAIQTIWALSTAVREKKPFYLRLAKEKTPIVTTEKTPFKAGGGHILITGDNITIITSGPITSEVLYAARDLKQRGIDAEVISLPCIKPLDEKLILSSIKKTKCAAVVEEHQIIGGLGGAVSELLGGKLPVPVTRIGMENCFGCSGKYKQLLVRYGLDASSICGKVIKFLKGVK